MKLKFKSRIWHKWSGLLIALPILIVALSAFLMAHRKTLGTEDIKVAAQWLPGYQATPANAPRNEARSMLRTAGGETYLGTLGGLYRLSDDRLVAVEEIGDTQIRGLAEAAWGRVAAARSGIWLETDGKWQRIVKGDAWNAASQPDGSIVVAIRDKGLLASHDGRRWQADPAVTAALAGLPNGADEPIALSKLVFDLHTGRALFGREGEWIWIDLLSAALCLLALTGVYMWWRTKRRKTSARQPAEIDRRGALATRGVP